jgi:hypothetical protein
VAGEVLEDGPEGRGHNLASRHHSRDGVLAVAVADCRDQHCRYSQLGLKEEIACLHPSYLWLAFKPMDVLDPLSDPGSLNYKWSVWK